VKLRRLGGLSLASAALALAAPRAAAAESLRLVDTLVLEWRGDNDNGAEGDDDYGLARTKLYLTGEAEGTSARAQVDAALFSEYPDGLQGTPEEPSAFRDEARLERLTVSHTIGDGTITVGDQPRQLGRGLALSLRKIDELGVDQALRGGSVGYDGDRLAGALFAGRTNVSNVDGVTQKHLEDPEDVLAGATGTLHLGRVALSGHGLVLVPKVPTLASEGDDRTVVGGAYVEAPFEHVTLYVEGALESYLVAGREEQGTAAYAQLDLDLLVVSLLLEGLYLDRFQVLGSYDPVTARRTAYNQPPTLERLDQEVLDSEDARGGRAKVTRSLFDGDLVLYVSGMFRQYGPEEARVDALHGYGGFELAYGGGHSRWNASGGLRDERQDDESFKSMTHGETDWVQAITAGYGLHLNVAHEERTLLTRDSRRGTTLLGVEKASLGSLGAEYGYDTFNETTRQHFVAGHLTLEAAEWLSLRAVVGSQRGGIKCVGGVCRDFPAFSGGRLEASVQYDLL